jgi:predicted nucleic acid-binding protein
MIIVPDASILLKWVLQKEEGSDLHRAFQLQAALLAEEVDVRLPTLWRYEVGNVLGLKQPTMARELMSGLLAYDFEEVSLGREYCLAVLEHMHDVKGVTFYESAYHVLALRSKGLYLTADVGYVKRAKRRGHVALLSEWDGMQGRS